MWEKIINFEGLFKTCRNPDLFVYNGLILHKNLQNCIAALSNAGFNSPHVFKQFPDTFYGGVTY